MLKIIFFINNVLQASSWLKVVWEHLWITSKLTPFPLLSHYNLWSYYDESLFWGLFDAKFSLIFQLSVIYLQKVDLVYVGVDSMILYKLQY